MLGTDTLSVEEIRQNQLTYQIDEFVLDFLDIWKLIHQDASKLTIADIKNYSKKVLPLVTLPFFEKYGSLPYVEKYDAWIKSLSSIVINWVGKGRIMFPLRLITYEVINHDENLLEFFIQKILTKEISGTIENLFNLLFPKLINVAIPLTETDLMILKSLQSLHTISKDLFKGANIARYAQTVDVSVRTITRRMQVINFLQIPIAMHFLDMAQLGYETFLLSHFNPIPDQLKPFCHTSVDLSISQFSLFQIPINKSKVYLQIQDTLEPTIFHQLNRRIQNWNLSGLAIGKDGWKIAPAFLYCEPHVKILSPSPAMDVSLRPSLDTFRRLTPADIKILEFITTTGSLKNKKQLSETVKVSLPKVSERLDEYQKHNLITKIHQYFNIGLDYSISFCVTSPTEHEICWIDHFLTFPKVDLFYDIDKKQTLFFGHVKLPPKWFKDFARKVRKLKKDFQDVKFYYTIDPPDIPKWSLTLSDTYF
ncbi:MAG: hypothetical protein ACFFB2_16520 [Promethearchaeota archaeon]